MAITYKMVHVYCKDPEFLDRQVGQTVQTQIRLLQSRQGLHCLLFNLHRLEVEPLSLNFRVFTINLLENLGPLQHVSVAKTQISLESGQVSSFFQQCLHNTINSHLLSDKTLNCPG